MRSAEGEGQATGTPPGVQSLKCTVSTEVTLGDVALRTGRGLKSIGLELSLHMWKKFPKLNEYKEIRFHVFFFFFHVKKK